MKVEEILSKIDASELSPCPTDPKITKNSSNTIMYKKEMCGFAIRAIDDNYLCKYEEFFKKIAEKQEEIRTLQNLNMYIIKFSKYIIRKDLTECTVEEIDDEIKHTVVRINNANILFEEVKLIEEVDKI